MGTVTAMTELEAEGKTKKAAETAEADSGAETAGDERNSVVQAGIEALNNRLKRTLAGFESFHKRSEREEAQMFDLGTKSVLGKFLSVTDSLERSVAQAPESEDNGIKAYAEGMNVICRQLLKNLRKASVEAIDAKGKPFDPAYYNTAMHEDNEALDEGAVSGELQKNYLYEDSVLRHSMVKVVN